MTVMKVCVSLPPLSFFVSKIRGRTDTPVGAGTKERQLERGSMSFITVLLCGLHTIFFSIFTWYLLSLSSPLSSLFLSLQLTSVYLHFSLSLKQFPSHLSPLLLLTNPPSVLSSLPPSPPGWLCLDHVEHSRLFNIHHSGTSCKQNRPPSWMASTITVCSAKASSYTHTGQRRGGKRKSKG